MNEKPTSRNRKLSPKAAIVIALLCAILASIITWGAALKTLRQNHEILPIDDVQIYDSNIRGDPEPNRTEHETSQDADARTEKQARKEP